MKLSFWATSGQPWPDLLAACQRAEATGWDGIWVPDHFMPLAGGYGDEAEPPAEDPELSPVHEAWTMLGALAAVVSRVTLGAMVTGNTYRHPAVLAKMAATVDHISGGRLVLGLGAAWQENEHRRYGIPLGSARERSDRLEEACQVIKALFSQERSTFDGRYYQLHDAPLEPKPVQATLPLMIGGGGERRTLRTTARYADEWNAWGPPDLIAKKMAILDEHCGAVGRRPDDIRRTAAAMLWLAADADEAARVRAPMAHRGGLVGTSDELRATIERYAEIGVVELVVPDFNLGSRRNEMLDRLLALVR